MNYYDFLIGKEHSKNEFGFKPEVLPEYLFDFQKALVEWALITGRSAMFADCGLGKTLMYLVWAENIRKQLGKRILIITPLGVSTQVVAEGEKFSIECARSKVGKLSSQIMVTNYESLHHFHPSDFVGVVCDESSILKNFDGKRKAHITNFMKKIEYRGLYTATAAPNDYIELGTSSEALGYLGYMDMLGRFFKNDNQTVAQRGWGSQMKWRFKKHAEGPFWRWVCSWARSLRKPSDMGFPDNGFLLPELIEEETIVAHNKKLDGELFVRSAITLQEQRDERKKTIQERCAVVAEKVNHNQPAICWCNLNEEGDLLAKIIPDAIQVSGKDSDNQKEEKFEKFASRQERVLIIKPKIGAFGLNWQHCAHMTFFPSHSYEQYYQAVRRCWRFGQKSKVKVDLITTEGEQSIMKNIQRKSRDADRMFESLVSYMNLGQSVSNEQEFSKKETYPSWL